jgi:hypothetical protein
MLIQAATIALILSVLLQANSMGLASLAVLVGAFFI